MCSAQAQSGIFGPRLRAVAVELESLQEVALNPNALYTIPIVYIVVPFFG